MPQAISNESSTKIEDLLKELRACLLLHLRSGVGSELPADTLEIARALKGLVHGQSDLTDAMDRLYRRIVNTDDQVGEAGIAVLLDLVSETEAAALSSSFGEPDLLDLGDLVEAAINGPGPSVEDSRPEPTDEFEIDPEMLEVFAMEADELLSIIEDNLARLHVDPADREALWEVRRGAHTFKGSAGIVGLTRLSRLAHRLEDLLDQLYEAEAPVAENVIGLVAEAAARLRDLSRGVELPDSALEKVYEALGSALGGKLEAPLDVPSAPPAAERVSNEPSLQEPVRRAIVRVPAEALDRLAAASRDLTVSRSVFERRLFELEKQIDDLHNMTRRLQATGYKIEVDLEAALLNRGRLSGRGADLGSRATGPSAAFDPLELDRYTELHQNIRDLTEAANDSFAINTSLDAVKARFEDLLEYHHRLVGEVQKMVLDLKKVRFGTIANRLERSSAVAVEGEDKSIEVVIADPDVEIDSRLLDALAEPLMHLMRNAAVHGIETRETRRLLGKPEKGRITVSVSCSETHLEVSVIDDGQGIDHRTLKKKAIAAGLIDKKKTETMGEADSAELIFVRGLSTASEVGMYAGRGVGMSIIRDCLETLNGSISVGRGLQGGTIFTMNVPLAFAALRVLVVKAGRFKLAVPLGSIAQVIEREPNTLNENSVSMNDASMPVRSFTAEPGAYGIIAGTGNDRFVAAVDEILGTEEIALKPMPFLQQVPGIRGGAVLGSGDAVPVVDLAEMVLTDPVHEPQASSASAGFSVLVVDDSPSVRLLTSRLIEREGWSCSTAKDGIDALDQLRSVAVLPHIILTDIEMPRMDGYQLVEELARDERLSGLPVVFVTSRTNEKHRIKAAEIGVTEYLTKPFDAAALRSIVTRLLGST